MKTPRFNFVLVPGVAIKVIQARLLAQPRGAKTQFHWTTSAGALYILTPHKSRLRAFLWRTNAIHCHLWSINNSTMSEHLHLRYNKAFLAKSLGYALLHPPTTEILHVGVCGYFDGEGDWKTIVDIPNHIFPSSDPPMTISTTENGWSNLYGLICAHIFTQIDHTLHDAKQN